MESNEGAGLALVPNEEQDLFTREDILGAVDILYEYVPVPEWGAGKKVRVKGLTGTERDFFEQSLVKKTGIGKQQSQEVKLDNIRAKLCCLTMVDKEGKPLFKPNEIELLGKKSAAALDRVYEVAARLSKITKEDVDELAKNSESEASGDSSAG